MVSSLGTCGPAFGTPQCCSSSIVIARRGEAAPNEHSRARLSICTSFSNPSCTIGWMRPLCVKLCDGQSREARALHFCAGEPTTAAHRAGVLSVFRRRLTLAPMVVGIELLCAPIFSERACAPPTAPTIDARCLTLVRVEKIPTGRRRTLPNCRI